MYKYITRKKGLYVAYSVFTLLASVGGIAYGFVMGNLLDKAVANDVGGLIRSLILSLILMAVAVGCEYIYSAIAKKLCCDARYNLKNDLFSAFMHRDGGQTENGNSGEYINELTKNIDTFSCMYFDNIIQIPMVVLVFIISVVLCIVIEPIMLVVIVAFSVLISVVSNKCGDILNASMGAYAGGTGRYMSVVKDFLEGFFVIKSYGKADTIIARHERENRDVEKLNLKNESNMVMYSRVNEFLGLISNLTIIGVAGLFAIKGAFSIGIMLAFGQLADKITVPIAQVSQIYVDMKASKSIRDNFLKLLSYKNTEDVNGNAGAAMEVKSLDSSIAAENLGYRYSNGKEVFTGLNFTIKKNGHYLVTGESGSGKSTLLQLVSGIYRDYTGSLKYDGVEVKNIAVDSLHSLVSIVHQNTFMFNDTLKNNVTLFDDNYSDDEVMDALRRSGFAANKEMLSTVISENGANFSGGEKQRINLARAMLKKTQVLLLDEFTANLDAKTAVDVEKSVLGLKDVTIIHVTHHKNNELIGMYDDEIVVK